MAFKDTHQGERLRRLMAHCRRYPDREIRTGAVRDLYEAWGIGPKRSTAKRDVRALERRGVLTAHGPIERRRYRLAGGTR